MRAVHLLPLALLLALSGGLVRADDGTAVLEAPYEIGATVADLSGPGVDGETVRLSDLAITKAKAEAAVLAIAHELDGGEKATLETALKDIDGLVEDGELDSDMVFELASRVGQHFGLVPHEDKLAKAASLQDLTTWVMSSEQAPILVIIWSPRCPMCKNIYDERVHEIAGETGIRLLAVAANYPDKVEHIQPYLEGNGYFWSVILDPEQKINDILGGRKTPHCFLLDADRKLQYRGSPDNDPRDQFEGEERKDFLRTAIEAVQSGGAIPADMNDTEPAG